VRIGGSRKWRRAEIEEWVADGCPARPIRRTP
jgi:predicted DNA-binding transcriptional regulator AlpA